MSTEKCLAPVGYLWYQFVYNEEEGYSAESQYDQHEQYKSPRGYTKLRDTKSIKREPRSEIDEAGAVEDKFEHRGE